MLAVGLAVTLVGVVLTLFAGGTTMAVAPLDCGSTDRSRSHRPRHRRRR
jgi:hypothetical protein